jgi:AcrR family transcriptional regulator
MTRTRTVNETTDRRILRAAAEALARLGIERLTVGDIAKFAGLSRSAVYKHYPTKEAIFDAVMTDAAEAFLAAVRADMAVAPNTYRQVLIYAVSGTEYSSLPGSSERDLQLLTSERLEDYLRRTREFLTPYIETGIRQGEFRADLNPAHAAEWICRVKLTWYTKTDIVDLNDKADVMEFCDLNLRHMLQPDGVAG